MPVLFYFYKYITNQILKNKGVSTVIGMEDKFNVEKYLSNNYDATNQFVSNIENVIIKLITRFTA